MNSWEAVCAFLEALPGAERDPPGGREVVRVRGAVVAYPARSERSRPPGFPVEEKFLIVKVDRAERAALLHEAPETFFVTPHYEDYPPGNPPPPPPPVF